MKNIDPSLSLMLGTLLLTSLLLGVVGCGCPPIARGAGRNFGPYGGIVQDAETGAPIAGAEIQLTMQSSTKVFSIGTDNPVASESWPTASGADGRFSFPEVRGPARATWVSLHATFNSPGYMRKLIYDGSVSSIRSNADVPGSSADIESVPNLAGLDNVVKLRSAQKKPDSTSPKDSKP